MNSIFFESIFSPLDYGNLKLKNRLVMSPLATFFGTEKGGLGEHQIDYYQERAEGGVAMIYVEGAHISSEGRISPHRLSFENNEAVGQHRELAAAIKAGGAVPGLQLAHAGRKAPTSITGLYPVSAFSTYNSVTPVPSGNIARTLTKEEIAAVIDDFVAAALRAKETGYESIMFHGATSYLIHEFFSPLTNQRRDEYGSSLEGRARFAVELIRRAREELGSDFPISLRLWINEGRPGGYTVEDIVVWAPLLEDAGLTELNVASSEFTQNIVAASLQEIKKNAKKMLIGYSGGVVDPTQGEEIIVKEFADLVYLGRSLLADPKWPNKARNGRIKEIRKCLGCMNCHNLTLRGCQLRCAVNATTGKGVDYRSARVSSSPQRVVVVGGGVAGMEAARITREMGHEVILLEAQTSLGGHVLHASVPHGKESLKRLIEYLENEIYRLGVEVRLGVAVDAETVKKFLPGTVIVATGSSFQKLDVPGSELPHVVKPVEIFKGCAFDGGENVVVIGGGYIGSEAAEILSDQGKRVTLIEMEDDILKDPGVHISERMGLVARLNAKNVRIAINHRVKEITTRFVYAEFNGERRQFAADYVVVATGMTANTNLLDEISRENIPVYAVGDCANVGHIFDAIHSSANVVRVISNEPEKL